MVKEVVYAKHLIQTRVIYMFFGSHFVLFPWQRVAADIWDNFFCNAEATIYLLVWKKTVVKVERKKSACTVVSGLKIKERNVFKMCFIWWQICVGSEVAHTQQLRGQRASTVVFLPMVSSTTATTSLHALLPAGHLQYHVLIKHCKLSVTSSALIFFRVESCQWLKNWHSSGFPARRLAL